MIWAIICYAGIIGLLIWAALTIPFLVVKVVCWIGVAALTGIVLFAVWVGLTYSKMGVGGK